MKNILAVVLVTLCFFGTANAALFSRAGGTMVYDDVLNITWLADWNYAYTSGYAASNATSGGTGSAIILPNGGMGWDAANNWATSLVFQGLGGWRLPSLINTGVSTPCLGGNCSDSELGYMFYINWGAASGSAFSSGTNSANLSLFVNVKTSSYWTNAQFAPNFGGAYYFGTDYGGQGIGGQGSAIYSVAVRDGDVAEIPVPATLALLLAGIALCPTRRVAN